MNQRKEITEVFTPRRSTVNEDMYIQREWLEKQLRRSINGSMHSFLFGESGSGKTWLYKKVFEDSSLNYVIANCANASRQRSLTEEILSACVGAGFATKTGYSEGKKGGVSVGAKAEVSHNANYEVLAEDKLVQAFGALHKKSSGQRSVVVIDNVETIFQNSDLMGELSDLIILLDDDRYAKFSVKFLIVGVPSDVLEYFSIAKNATSVANRIEEIPRVVGLEYTQVLELLQRGFVEHLKVIIPELQLKRLARHVVNVTLGVPQRIHEYAECLAYAVEDNQWNFNPGLTNQADEGWLRKGLRESYSIVNSYLNADETTDGRRNQVIYALGLQNTHNIQTSQIGGIVASEFPATAPDSNSGVGQILGFLTNGEKPILKKISNSNAYTFCDPRYLMCIRVMLYKEQGTEKVRKKGFRLN